MTRSDIPRLDLVVLDCPDPVSLADFYARLLDWAPEGEPAKDAEWVTLRGPGGGVGIAFQRDTDYAPPTWPSPQRPQMLHLDMNVADATAAHERAVRLGAAVLDDHNRGFVVYADPAGHPFCLCRCD